MKTAARLAQEDQKDIQWMETLLNALASATHPDDLTAVREEMQACGLSNKITVNPGPGKNEKAANRPVLPPRQYTSSDGSTILVGRNNLQNDA